MSDLPNMPETRREQFLNAIATSNTSGLPEPVTREEVYLNYIAENGGGSGTTTNYNELSNKPKINNVELLGNISLNDLNIYDKDTIDNVFVAKETGKGLSSNDYTTAEKTKLAELENYDDTEIKEDITDIERVNTSQDALLIDNASKNILEITADNFTRNGITFTINRNEDNQVTSITANGTATSSVFFEISNVLDLEDNVEYILSGCPTGGKQNNTYILYISFESNNVMDSGDGVVFKKLSDVEAVRIAIYNGYTANNLTFYPMVRRAEITDDTFEPYYRSQKQLDTDLSAIEAKQETQNQKISEIEAYIGYTENDIYGVEADFENSVFTRLAGAVGKSAGSDFNSVNAFGGRRRCNLADDGTVNAYYGDNGYIEDGSNGQVMVEQPKFYYKVVPLKTESYTTQDNKVGYHLKKARYYISDTPKAGFKLHPAFIANGIEKDKIYYSAYEGSLYDVSESVYITDDSQSADFNNDKLSSIANIKPISGFTQNLTRANARTLAENRGNGWELSYIHTISASQLLMLIEYASFNMQSAIGNGVVSKTDDGTSNLAENTGGTSNLGNTSGSVSNGEVSYRGEENLWGNIWKWVDGLNCENPNPFNDGEHGTIYVADHGFADNTGATPYEDTDIHPCKTSGAYISAFGYNEKFDWLFIPTELKGNSSLPVGDMLWNDQTGWRIALLGGEWIRGSATGAFALRLYDASSFHNRAISGRLVYIPTEVNV